MFAKSVAMLCLTGCAFALAQLVQPEPEPVQAETITKLEVPEANQGIAVDHDYFYAIDNTTIAKYDKERGERVGLSTYFTPDTNRLVADINAPLEQQLMHVLVGKQKAVVEVDGIRDDDLRETVAFGTLS